MRPRYDAPQSRNAAMMRRSRAIGPQNAAEAGNRRGRRARPAARFFPRSVAVLHLRRPYPGECAGVLHAALGRVLRRGRSVHLHLGLHRGFGLWQKPPAQRRALCDGADLSARVAALCRAHLHLRHLHRRGLLYLDRGAKPHVHGGTGGRRFSEPAASRDHPRAALGFPAAAPRHPAAVHRAARRAFRSCCWVSRPGRVCRPWSRSRSIC